MNQLEKFRIDINKQWAIVEIDEISGSFFAQTSLGDFSYIWPPTRRDESLKKFIADVDFDYFSEKAFQGETRCLDYKETVKCARKMIRDAQTRGDISKDEAKTGRALVLSGSRRNEEGFIATLYGVPQRAYVFGDDWWHFIQRKRAPQLVKFEKTLWPALRARLLEEI